MVNKKTKLLVCSGTPRYVILVSLQGSPDISQAPPNQISCGE
jgi:hypothetical protein